MSFSEPFDLVVVGGGLAGLVAANRAAELGARVAVFEAGTGAKYPANSRYTGGVFHVAFRDIRSAPGTLLDAIAAATGRHADPELSRALAEDAGRTIDWLAEHGATFAVGGDLPFMNNMLVPLSLRETGFANHWPDKGADRLLDTLEQSLRRNGGTLERGMRAVRLLMAQGSCEGLQLIDADGCTHTVRARSVAICDGGFAGNPELVRKHLSPRPDLLCQRGAGTGLGDGIQMAAAAGAILVDMDRFYGHVQCAQALHDDALWPYPILDIVSSVAVVVGPDGRRFTDEGLGGVSVANAIAALPDPLSSFVVMDHSVWNGAGREFLLPPNPALSRHGVEIVEAPTLEALAEKLRMPVDTLARTVADYNDAVERKVADTLDPPRTGAAGTMTRAPSRLTQAPWLAIRLCAGLTYTMGGIAIDAHGRALDADRRPISGLYAAGACTGGIEGGPRSGYVGGLAKAAVFGLRVGEAVCTDRR